MNLSRRIDRLQTHARDNAPVACEHCGDGNSTAVVSVPFREDGDPAEIPAGMTDCPQCGTVAGQTIERIHFDDGKPARFVAFYRNPARQGRRR